MEKKKLKNENISVRLCKSLFTDSHEHDFLELAYVTEGCAEHYICGRKTVISKGDYFIVDYNTVHSYYSIDDAPFAVINVLFHPKLIDNSLTYCRSFRALLNHYLIKIDSGCLRMDPSNHIFCDPDGRIYAHLQSLLEEYEKKQLGFTEIMRSILIEILIITMRKISSGDRKNDVIRYLTDYVAENYVSPLPLSVLAKELGYSLPYLSARFKKEMGCGFQDYLIRIRIEEACRLLANTDRKILDIAADVGYSDTNFFYMTFRRLIGKSPNEFRKSIST